MPAMKPLPFLLSCSLILGAVSCQPHGRSAEDAPKTEARPAADSKEKSKGLELVGILHRPKSAKSAYWLEIYPKGNLKILEMLGEPLRDIPEKTAVRVRGVVKSQVVGSAKGDPDAYPVQWGVWLFVSEVQTFASVEEAFREPRERFLNGAGK
jgi:hypothetical protein